jgi:hypothetical protein
MGLPLGMGRSGQRENKRYDEQIFQGPSSPRSRRPRGGDSVNCP